MVETKKQIIIEIDPEFSEVLDKLEKKIKDATWEGLETVSKKSLTRILAKKIKASKLV